MKVTRSVSEGERSKTLPNQSPSERSPSLTLRVTSPSLGEIKMFRPMIWSLLVVVLCVRGASAQTVWPGEDWETAAPASQGMDAEGLEKARGWLESHNSKS